MVEEFVTVQYQHHRQAFYAVENVQIVVPVVFDEFTAVVDDREPAHEIWHAFCKERKGENKIGESPCTKK